MRNSADARDTYAEGIHIRDCYIWAEIYYLDSSTNYREFLPKTATPELRGDGLVLLDSAPESKAALAILIAIALILLGLAGYFLFLVIGMIDAF